MRKTTVFIMSLVLLFSVLTAAVEDNVDQSWYPQDGIKLQECPSYILQPGQIPISIMGSKAEDTISYDGYTNANGVGYNTTGAVWASAIRLTPTELGAYAGYDLIAVVIYRTSGTTINDTLKILSDSFLTTSVIHEQPFSPATTTWNRIDLTTPVPITGTADLWIADIHEESPGDHPSGADAGPIVATKGGWMWSAGSGWVEISAYGIDRNWNIWAIVEQTGGTGTTWDFEDGWQDWTHTSSSTFPAAWDVQASDYKPSYTCPDAGDSSMWIDSDAAGSMTIIDTAISPAFTSFPETYLKWAYSYNEVTGTDSFGVLIGQWSGGTLTWTKVAEYLVDENGAYDSVDVSGYSADSFHVGFYYEGSYDYYAAFDNVGPVELISDFHDVASVEFLSPGTSVSPATIDVIGVVTNNGTVSETYDVHCVVADPAIVLDTTINVTTGVGESDTINFGSVNFQDATTYNLEMVTLLVGDQVPANDTLNQTTDCSSAGWDILTDMNIAKSGCYIGYQNEYTTDLANYIHVFGGNAAPQTEHQVYDISAGTWTTAASVLPAVKRYGATITYGNFIYLIAGFDDQTIVIWDIAGDSCWVSAATTTRDNRVSAVLVGDLIYIAGGGAGGWVPGTNVEIYDIAGDSIYAATSLPVGLLGGAFGYIGNDTLIYASGYLGSGNISDATYLGYIDPTNPANITWTTGTAIPGGGQYSTGYGSVVGTSVSVLYLAGGTDGSSTNRAYAYISGTGWTTLPNKPTTLMNINGVIVPSAGDQAWFYVAGGYSPYSAAFERYRTGVALYIEENPGTVVGDVFTFRMLSPSIISDRARIEFNLPVSSQVTFTIYDLSGREVRRDNFSNISAGVHTMNWGLIDNNNNQVSAGTYFFRLEAGENIATGKLIIAR